MGFLTASTQIRYILVCICIEHFSCNIIPLDSVQQTGLVNTCFGVSVCDGQRNLVPLITVRGKS